MEYVNKPEVAKSIVWAYGVLLVFIVILALFFSFAAFLTPLGIGGAIASVVIFAVGAIISMILASLYRTRYVLTSEALIIKTTMFIGGSKRILLADVKSIEKTMIPFGIRLFGASFHGGYYHIPNLGRTFLAITNFKDGLLIRTNQSNYIITPSNPMEFKTLIENGKVSGSQSLEDNY